MSLILPLFPLRLVAFPGEQLNLHIFEPRYKQLVNECEANGTSFGINAYMNNKLQEIGTEMELLSIDNRYPDGKMDIRTRALGIFRIITFYQTLDNSLYSGGEIERLQFDVRGEELKYQQILHQLKNLYDLMGITKPVPELTDDFTTYKVGHIVGFSLEQEYKFLCIRAENDRQNYMLRHLKRILQAAKEMEELKKKVQMNGHFKNILPPEL
jgi:hypothetical protein